MKTNDKWQECFYEKVLPVDAAQNHLDNPDYSAKNSLKLVNFYCAAPQAQTVEITGDFNHWHSDPMHRLQDGWWFIRLELSHGHHHYRFIVDGQSQLDARAMGVAHGENDEMVSLMAVS